MKRSLILKFSLCFLISLLCLISCKNNTADVPEDALLPVFSETRIQFPDEYTGKLKTDSLSFANGRIYADVYREFMSDEVGEYAEIRTVSWNLNGGDFMEENSISMDSCIDGAMVISAVTLADGMTATYEIVYEGDIISGFLCLRNEKGDTVFKTDLPGALDYDMTYEYRMFESGEGLRMNGAAVFDTNTGKQYVAATTAGLACFNEQGKTVWTLGNTNAAAVFFSGGGLYCFINTQYGQKLYPVDMNDGKRGKEIALPDELIRGGISEYSFFTGSGALHGVYYQNNIGLWALDFEKDEKGENVCRYELMIDWNESNLYGKYTSIFVIDENTVCALKNEGSALKEDWYLSILSRVPADEVVEPVEIKVYCMGNGARADLRTAAVAFNRTHPGYRITVTDYFDDYENYEEAARLRLNAIIASGEGPDMILISPVSNYDTTLDEYLNAHVFTDLNVLFDAIQGFDRSDLLGYLTKPYTSKSGEQYVIPIDGINTVGTYITDGSIIKSVVTAEEMMEYINEYPDMFKKYGTASLLFTAGINDFFDIDKGICSFDDGRFAERLRFSNEYGSRITPEEKSRILELSREERLQSYLNKEDMLYTVYNFTSLLGYVTTRERLGGNMVPVGYPNEERLLYASDNYKDVIGITASSKYKEISAEFIASFYAAGEIEIPDVNPALLYSVMSVNQNRTHTDIVEQAKCFEGRTVVIDDKRGIEYIVYDSEAGDYDGIKFKITEKDAEEFINFLDSFDRIASTGNAVWEFYREEVSLSQVEHTPEEIAGILQSRVSIYLSEHKK